MNRPALASATTLVGVVLTAMMLFPLYWMVNVSLTQPRNCARIRPTCSRSTRTSTATRGAQQQGPYLLTSLVVGLGTVVLTVGLSAPAAFALAKLRPAGRTR